MREVLEQAEALAAFSEVPVLIGGESGTGKELVARHIHARSERARHAFVAVNAAAFPDTLLEAELFGHSRGAFTGAEQARKGLLEEAHRGTLFLDEVADLSLRAQTVLLRALQEREYRRVGEATVRHSDFRLLTATHKRLEVEVAGGRFRSDLFFRLDVARIELPPLRERPSDIAALARHCLREKARALGFEVPRLSPETERSLLAHSWPGNVRELQNEMTQALVRARGASELLPAHLSLSKARGPQRSLKSISQAAERTLLKETLLSHDGNRTRTARALGISRQGLYRKLKKHGLERRSASGERSFDLR